MKKPSLMVVFLQHSGGGAEKQSVLLANALKTDFDITLVVAKPVPESWRHTMCHKGFRVITLQKADTFLQRRLRCSRLLRVCQTLDPDIIYSRYIGFNFYLAKQRGMGKLLAPLIIQEVITPSELVNGGWHNRLLYKKRFLHWYPYADLVLCNSRMARQDLMESFHLCEKKCMFVPNVVPRSDFMEEVSLKRHSHRAGVLKVISVGRLVRQKAHEVLLDAVALLHGDIPVQVDIFGDGPLKKILSRRIEKLGISSSVTMRGFVPEAKSLYPEYDVLVSCSSYEGMSNVILEAMASGLPVVSTDVAGTRDIITGETEGVIFKRGDAIALAGILRDLSKNRKRLRMLAGGGKRRAERFSIDNLSERYRLVFRDVLNESSGKR